MAIVPTIIKLNYKILQLLCNKICTTITVFFSLIVRQFAIFAFKIGTRASCSMTTNLFNFSGLRHPIIIIGTR